MRGITVTGAKGGMAHSPLGAVDRGTDGRIEMIVAIRVQPSQHGGGDEYVRLAGMATMGGIFEELAATARHYARVRGRHHRATAWSSAGRMLAAVGVSPDALASDEPEDVREAAA